MSGKLLVPRNENPAVGVDPTVSPNAGQYGWSSFESAHFNQLLEYVNFTKKTAESLNGKIDYIDLRISDAERALANVYKAVENTVLKYDDFLSRYEAVLIYFNQMGEWADSVGKIAKAFTTVVYEDVIGTDHTIVAGDSNYFSIKLDAPDATVNIISGSTSLVSQGFKLTLVVEQTTGNNNITWDANIKWPQGSPPTLSYNPGAIDVFEFVTVDGGNVWYGSVFGRDY